MHRPTLVDLLEAHANDRPAQVAYQFLVAGDIDGPAEILTWAELHRRVQAVAGVLQDAGAAGDRALLLYHQGLDFIVAFLGCLAAGVVAVPAYPPEPGRLERTLGRLRAVAADCGARLVLTTSAIAASAEALLPTAPELASLQWIASDQVPATSARARQRPALDPAHIAFLQYTSGSTGTPKGVMVSHANLMHNALQLQRCWELTPESRFVVWMPLYHDMGLIAHALESLFVGMSCMVMSPTAFLQRPARWLEAISSFQATTSGGPNFAYELCLRKVTEAERARLDLSRWEVAVNAAEPVRATTMERFAAGFASCGFRREAFMPCYGLAEGTVFVTGGTPAALPLVVPLDGLALEQGRVVVAGAEDRDARVLVGCGYPWLEQQIAIVDPVSGRRAGESEVGEIWLAGESVAQGYWNREEETVATFGARLAESGERPFLRTGDLGFLHAGELFIAGRLKDLVIVGGRNLYPQDVELTAEQAHAAVRPGCAAVFSVEVEGEEQLVVAAEVDERARAESAVIAAAIRAAVAVEHGVGMHAVALLKMRTLPKTTSGKVQRRACRAAFLSGKLALVAKVVFAAPESAAAPPAGAGVQEDLEGWLTRRIAALAGIPAAALDPSQPLARYGLGSRELVELSGELAARLGRSVSPAVFYEHPSLSALIRHLVGGSDESSAPRLAATSGVGPLERPTFESIAVIGMDCRFPGAAGVEAFWELLQSGRTSVASVSAERQRLTGYDAGEADAFRWGGFLDGIEQFDAKLFEISPREAASLDPQQRLLLETSWRALESANIPPDSLAGSATGVFVGVSLNDYFQLERDAVSDWDVYAGTGGALSITANRISYCLGLQGPSIAVDSACSSSLVAVHQACLSLTHGEIHLALVGGVNVVLSSDIGKIFTKARMLSPTGRCQTFDEAADGYVRGEGCGVIVLKRLADAVRAGDRVLAVIRGSAVNQDGYSNGLTAPNGLAQQRVVRHALERAGVAAATVGYVETHGTGTPLGDPIEVRSLRAVHDGVGADTAMPCWLGAVKTNIGHLEAAAGIAGLIKTVLVLNHGRIPPNCNFRHLNPHIDLKDSRLRLATELTEWPAPTQHPRRAGVSSFGFGGTNAHVVLEALTPTAVAPQSVPRDPRQDDRVHLLALSARTESSLRALAGHYARCLEERDGADSPGALCRAAHTARARLPERLAVVRGSIAELSAALDRIASGESSASVGVSMGFASRSPRIAFLFTGQGAQHVQMGHRLYAAEPVFRSHLDLCDEILKAHLDLSIREVIFGADSGLLQNTRLSQPALVALELALVEQWRHWGVRPEFLAGHSIGEYAAACAAGLMDLETVLRVVAARGRLMASAPGEGAMISVRAGLDEVTKTLSALWDQLDLAAINTPGQIVLSGTAQIIQEAATALEQQGYATTRLQVSHAFHSRLMDPVLDEFRSVFESVRFHAPRRRLVLTSGDGGDDPATPAYWVNQLRRPVRFVDAMNRLADLGADTFVEVGPAPVLIGLGQQILARGTWLASLRAKHDDRLQIRAALGELFVHGAEVDLKRLDDHHPVPLVTAPLYPFDRAPYWFASDCQSAARLADAAPKDAGGASLLGRRLDLALDGVVCFETTLPGGAGEFLLDHRVYDRSIMPGAGYVSLALEAARQARLWPAGEPVVLRDLRFLRPLDLSGGVRVQTLLQRGDAMSDEWQVRIAAWDPASERWEPHASGTLGRPGALEPLAEPPAGRTGLRGTVDMARFYARWSERGLQYRARFQALTDLEEREGTVIGRITLSDAGLCLSAGTLHPVVLDAAFQALGCLLFDREEGVGRVPLPTSIAALTVRGDCGNEVFVEGRLGSTENLASGVLADLVLTDEHGKVIAEVRGLEASWVDAAAGLAGPVKDELPTMFYLPVWTDAEPADPARRPVRGAPADPVVLCVYPPAAAALKQTIAAGHGPARCFEVLLGNVTHQRSPVAWEVDLADPDAFGPILEKLPRFDTVYFLGGIQPVELAAATQPGSGQHESVISLFRLLRALSPHPSYRGQPLTIKTVTNGAHAVLPGEQAQPFGASVFGLIRSASREYPDWAFCQIDLEARAPERALDALAPVGQSIIDEGSDPHGAEIALRSGRRYRRVLHPHTLAPSAQSPFREHGAYLILGGGGGIGLGLAHYLATTAKARVALLGRSPLQAEQQRLISQIERLGGEILYLRADATDLESLRSAVQRTKAHFGTLNGVIHAAVVLQDKALDNMDESMLRTALAPKVTGSVHLYQAVAEESLDFLVFFSSVQSFFGNAGQANYAAASTFQDAFAQAISQQARYPVKTINWGYWGQIGVAAAESYRERLARQGVEAILPHEGMEALRRMLLIPARQVVAIKADHRVLAQMGVIFRASGAGVPGSAAPLELISPAELARLPEADASQAILRGLASILGTVLRTDVDRQFGDGQRLAAVRLSSLGVDSLMATELRNRVRAWSGVDVPAHMLIGGSRIAEVVELIHQKTLLLSLSQPKADEALPEDSETFVL